MLDIIQIHGLERAAAARRKHDPVVTEFAAWYERAMCRSLARFGMSVECGGEATALKATGPVYRRNMTVKGPMSVFGYDYFADRYKQPLKLTDDARYEILNFADGTRTTSQIRDALSAIYGPIPLEDVEQYLAAAASIGVVNKVSGGPQ
jgi:hypothetical protein